MSPRVERGLLASPGRENEAPFRFSWEGADDVIETTGPDRFERLREQAEALFARDPSARLFGQIDFEGRARFVRAHAEFEFAPRRDPTTSAAHIEALDPDYPDRVQRALEAIAHGPLQKVVLARRLCVTRAEPFTLDHFLARADEPDSLLFAFEREGAAFVGQTPERLVRLAQGIVSSDALAGTRPIAADPAELLTHDKERREHALVVDAIRAGLSSWGTPIVPSEPTLRRFRTVQHLATPITCRLDRPAHLLDLAQRLHPTPALGGAPREEALALISRLEGDTRGGYGGLVGWFDARGEGELWVAIRSARLEGNRATVFAGAGIVAGSTPSFELSETTAKAASILRALGVTHDP